VRHREREPSALAAQLLFAQFLRRAGVELARRNDRQLHVNGIRLDHWCAETLGPAGPAPPGGPFVEGRDGGRRPFGGRSTGTMETRKPVLHQRLSGALALRLAERQ
jgi:hypothetical protein